MAEARAQSGRRRRFSVDALFTDTSPRGAGVTDLVDAKQIDIDRIQPDPSQPRKDFNDDALAELAASIRLDGILQPIAVRYDNEQDTYVILHGERRWRAARMAGLGSLPAIVRDVPEERRLVQQLVENVVREDLNVLDRAAALRALKVQMNDAPWERVAEAVGIRRSRLFQLLGTEKLDDTLQSALRQGIVSEKQTRAAQSLPGEAQHELGSALLDGSLAPHDLEAAARERKPPSPASRARKAAGTDALVSDTLRHARALATALEQLESADMALNDADTAQLTAALRDAERRIDAVLSTLEA
jgi:ParB family transcriptional regulator, chromosome partitioning protein